MGHHKSINKTLSFTEPIYERLEKLAIENGFITSTEVPNVSRYIREVIIKTHLDVEKMEGLPDYKKKTGRKTPDIIRSSTYQTINAEGGEVRREN